jgi:hypothetical protein
MFGDQFIYCSVDVLHVKAKAKEQDTNRYIEVGFSVPLTQELAAAISKPMAKHLYSKQGGEFQPDKTLGDSSYLLNLGAQRIELKDHAELKVIGVIPSASIKKVWANKTQGGEWEISFTCSFPLGDLTAATELMKRVKAGVWMQMAEQSPEMKGMEPDNEPAEPADTEPAESAPAPA